jgi:hypothetical protein
MVGFPLLITSAINNVAPFVALNDHNKRLESTLVALQHWRRIAPELKIVLCDGSNFDLTTHIHNILGESDNIEILKFKNDQDAVKKYGKGYGEGEIINYALKHSAYLNQNKVFAKCTSKLWVENFAVCTLNFKENIRIEKCYTERFSNKYNYCDTRFYMVEKKFYLEHLRLCHEQVRDFDGFYLEHSFAKNISESRLRSSLFPELPLIYGQSGSSGCFYVPNPEKFLTSAKRRIRNLLVK